MQDFPHSISRIYHGLGNIARVVRNFESTSAPWVLLDMVVGSSLGAFCFPNCLRIVFPLPSLPLSISLFLCLSSSQGYIGAPTSVFIACIKRQLCTLRKLIYSLSPRTLSLAALHSSASVNRKCFASLIKSFLITKLLSGLIEKFICSKPYMFSANSIPKRLLTSLS